MSDEVKGNGRDKAVTRPGLIYAPPADELLRSIRAAKEEAAALVNKFEMGPKIIGQILNSHQATLDQHGKAIRHLLQAINQLVDLVHSREMK